MIKVFASGSCRLLTSNNNGHGKIEPIHSMFKNFIGVNFLGKLHNTKQHIQFIKWIKDEIELPLEILSSFLTSYGTYKGSRELMEALELNLLATLKLYERNGYKVQLELTDDYTCLIQSEDDLYNDLIILRSIIPHNKSLIFQSHFRPNIIYKNPVKLIDKRESIYNTLKKFCDTADNTYLYDPSIILQNNKLLFDGDTHFYDAGHLKSFEYMYKIYMDNPNKKN